MELAPKSMKREDQITVPDHRTVLLDILRAIAVILVILHHTGLRVPPHSDDIISQTLYRSGWIGVDLFFAISGFLIASIVMKPNFSAADFFRKRFFRILPLYAVAMIAFLLASWATGRTENLGYFWSPLLLLNGWTIPFLGEKNVPYVITWSLSVEETAYIILGCAGLFGKRALRYAVVSMVLFSMSFRIWILVTEMIPSQFVYFFVPARLDAIAVGGLAAFGCLGQPNAKKTAAAAIGALMLIYTFAIMHVSRAEVILLGFSAFSLCAATMVIGLVDLEKEMTDGSRLSKFLAYYPVKVISMFGKLSYFVYLFHIFFVEAAMLLVVKFLNGSWAFWFVVAASSALAFFAARISWKWFEAPLIERGKRGSWRTAFS